MPVRTQDIILNCSECGRKVGVLTIFAVGTVNMTDLKICCLKCLPRRLHKLEKEGYNPNIIKSIREWMAK